jgi:hypothetical protein
MLDLYATNAKPPNQTTISHHIFKFSVFALFRCFTPNAFWLGAGVVFAPMGFFGALRFKRALVLGYAAYCLIEVVLTVVFTFVFVHDRIQTAAFLLSAAGEVVVFYHVWRFFRAIPVDEVIRV